MGNVKPDSGTHNWGVTTSQSYFPKDNTPFFDTDENMTEWLRKYSEEQDDSYVRGFLGRMLFSLSYPGSDYDALPPRLRRENLKTGFAHRFDLNI